MDRGANHINLVRMGASNHCLEERAKDDYYKTEPKIVEELIKIMKKENLINKEWGYYEPACGDGAISDPLKCLGLNVYAADIVDRGADDLVIEDFFNVDKLPFDGKVVTVTNPPYGKLAEQFLRHILDIMKPGDYYITLQKIQFFEGKNRREIFDKDPPKKVMIFSERVNCWKNGMPDRDKNGKIVTSAVCYCWFIWEKGFKGETTVGWI